MNSLKIVGAFNPEKDLVGAFSVIEKSLFNLRLKLYCVEAGGWVMGDV